MMVKTCVALPKVTLQTFKHIKRVLRFRNVGLGVELGSEASGSEGRQQGRYCLPARPLPQRELPDVITSAGRLGDDC